MLRNAGRIANRPAGIACRFVGLGYLGTCICVALPRLERLQLRMS